MKLKRIILLTLFIFILSASRIHAKTVMYLNQNNLIVKEEQDVLGVSSNDTPVKNDQKPQITVESVDQILSLIPTSNKLTVKSIGESAKDFAGGEIDKLVLIESEEGTHLEGQDGLIIISNDGVDAQTDLPIIVTQQDGKIIVSQNNHTQTLNLLPSDAKRLIEETKNTIEESPVKLVLKEDHSEIVYEYSQENDNKLFGIIPLTTTVTTTVSAQTGKVSSRSSSFLFDFIKQIFV